MNNTLTEKEVKRILNELEKTKLELKVKIRKEISSFSKNMLIKNLEIKHFQQYL